MKALEYRRAMAYGEGTFVDSSNEVYRGTFVDNQIHGYCEKRSRWGLVTLGEMKGSRWDGKVTVYSTDGRIYNQIYISNKQSYQIQVKG